MPEPRVLIVSPVRNEAEHLELVIASVVGQDRRPNLWLIVDDGSEDETAALARAAAAEHAFIRVVSTPPGLTAETRDRLAAAAAPRALNWGLEQVDWRGFDFLGKLDGDTELCERYLSRLLAHFAEQPQLGIAGGVRAERSLTGWRVQRIPRVHVPGALKLWRRECFEAIGGVQERLGWDGIDEVYARMNGWATWSFDDLVTRHHRPWGSADGRLRGKVRYGRSAYVSGQPAAWVAAKVFRVALEPPIAVSGIAFGAGYAHAAVRRLDRVDDAAYRAHVRRELRARIKTALL